MRFNDQVVLKNFSKQWLSTAENSETRQRDIFTNQAPRMNAVTVAVLYSWCVLYTVYHLVSEVAWLCFCPKSTFHLVPAQWTCAFNATRDKWWPQIFLLEYHWWTCGLDLGTVIDLVPARSLGLQSLSTRTGNPGRNLWAHPEIKTFVNFWGSSRKRVRFFCNVA